MRAWRRFVRERTALTGALFIALIVVAAIFGPLIDTTPPNAIVHSLLGVPQPPSLAHWVGTDLLGRDLFVRLLYGARVSLLVGAAAMVLSFAIGVLYGAIAGFSGGFIDNAMMRFVDAMLSFPTFFLLLIVAALTNTFSLWVIIVIIGLTAWPGLSRLVRAEVLSLRDRDFVEAARALGASPWRLIFKHLIPNALAPVFVAAAFAIGDNILAESSLSFFGLGVQPPSPSWGNMLQDALTPQAEAAPWMVLGPGLAIVATVLAFSVVADGIRVALDASISQEGGAADDLEVEVAPHAAPAPSA